MGFDVFADEVQGKVGHGLVWQARDEGYPKEYPKQSDEDYLK